MVFFPQEILAVSCVQLKNWYACLEISTGNLRSALQHSDLSKRRKLWMDADNASLPKGISLPPNKDEKEAKSTREFTITLPRNQTNQIKTYRLIFHTDELSAPTEASLDERNFTCGVGSETGERHFC